MHTNKKEYIYIIIYVFESGILSINHRLEDKQSIQLQENQGFSNLLTTGVHRNSQK